MVTVTEQSHPRVRSHGHAMPGRAGLLRNAPGYGDANTTAVR